MDDPPRPADEPVLTRGHWTSIGVYGAIIAGAVIAGLLIGLWVLDLSDDAAVTISFMTIGFAKLWFVLNLRGTRAPFWKSPVVRNPWLWGAIVLCAGLLIAAVYLPGLSGLLQTENIGWSGWGVVLALSLAPVIAGQIYLVTKRLRQKKS
jgi:Ca2+-transporting ATPase